MYWFLSTWYHYIPLDVFYDIIRDRWNEFERCTPIPCDLFIKLTKFCCKKCNYFSFNGKFYKQTFGGAMGSPIVPIIADIVMNQLLDYASSLLTFSPTFIFKYVDDLLLTLPPDEIDNTCNILNSFHPRLQFTYEKQDNNQINYLDTTIHINNDSSIDTNWYSKPTSKYRLLNFLSNHPYHQKLNIIDSTIRRTLSLSSTKFHTTNIIKIKDGLKKNNYPDYLIDQHITKYFDKLNHVPLPSPPPPSTPNINQTLTPKPIFCSMTFVDTLSPQIIKMINTFLPNNSFKIAFKSYKTIKNSFFTKLKDKTEKGKTANTIYKIQCNDCNGCYIGQSSQYLSKRISQHRNDARKSINQPATPNPRDPNRLLPYPVPHRPDFFSPLINSPHLTITPNTSPITPNSKSSKSSKSKEDNSTALAEHAKTTKHEFDFTDYKILSIENNKIKRLTKESLYILSHKDSINKKTDTQGISKIYIDFTKDL